MKTEIIYKTDVVPEVEQIVALYDQAELPRPTADGERIRKMFENSDVIVTAWDAEKLVGAARSVTDWVWCCYLSDLAVNPDYQKSGIGKKLIELTREAVGDEAMILLLSVPSAMEYYPRVGFAKENRAFSINRRR